MISASRSRVGRKTISRVEQGLFFTPTEEFANYSRRVTGQYIALLHLVAGLTSLLAGLAVVNLLFGSVAVRRRELALMRVAGGTDAIIAGLVLVDGLAIALVGCLGGLVLGLASSRPMSDLLAETLGWQLTLAVDPLQLAYISIGVLMISTLTAIYPAWAAQRINAMEMLDPE